MGEIAKWIAGIVADWIVGIIIVAILVCTIAGAYYARQAAHAPRVIIREVIVVVDTAADAEALAIVMADFIQN